MAADKEKKTTCKVVKHVLGQIIQKQQQKHTADIRVSYHILRCNWEVNPWFNIT